MEESYFRLDLSVDFGDDWGDLKNSGKYIIQNRDNLLKVDSVLPFLIFHFVTNYNLSDLELFFRLAGFTTFTKEEFPDSLNFEVFKLPNEETDYPIWFGEYTDEEEAKQYIESELGIGIISKFNEVKRAQLIHKKAKLYEQMRLIEQEILFTEQKIEYYTQACASSHQLSKQKDNLGY